MFDKKVKVLKSKYDLICEELRHITDEYNNNLKKQSKVKKLRECRRELNSRKKILIGMPFACLAGVIIGCLLVFLLNPAAFMALLPNSLLTSFTVSSVIILFRVFDYFNTKNKYKKIATVENLNLERNYDEILSNGISLGKKLKSFNEKASTYENLISYFRNYNSKVNLLNSVVNDEKNNSEDLGIDNSYENRDYSKVNLTESFGPKQVKKKSLFNNKYSV